MTHIWLKCLVSRNKNARATWGDKKSDNKLSHLTQCTTVAVAHRWTKLITVGNKTATIRFLVTSLNYSA